MGYVIDNDTLLSAIRSKLYDLMSSTSSNLQLIPTTVESVQFPNDTLHSSSNPDGNFDSNLIPTQWPQLMLSNHLPSILHTSLIVAADGARSRIRTLADMDWYSYSYDQSAIVANVSLDTSTTTAYQRFLSTGPLALLPLASHDTQQFPYMANIVWSTTHVEARALEAADDIVFLDELNRALFEPDDQDIRFSDYIPFSFNPRSSSSTDNVINVPSTNTSSSVQQHQGYNQPPRCTQVLGARARFPLTLGHAPKYVSPPHRLALVGDAAHTVHPLAGQGVNLGFADARALTGCIATAAATGRDVGGENGAPLASYQRTRIPANLLMSTTLHALHATFAMQQLPGFAAARRLGVSVLNEAAPLKRAILRAMS